MLVDEFPNPPYKIPSTSKNRDTSRNKTIHCLEKDRIKTYFGGVENPEALQIVSHLRKSNGSKSQSVLVNLGKPWKTIAYTSICWGVKYSTTPQIISSIYKNQNNQTQTIPNKLPNLNPNLSWIILGKPWKTIAYTSICWGVKYSTTPQIFSSIYKNLNNQTQTIPNKLPNQNPNLSWIILGKTWKTMENHSIYNYLLGG